MVDGKRLLMSWHLPDGDVDIQKVIRVMEGMLLCPDSFKARVQHADLVRRWVERKYTSVPKYSLQKTRWCLPRVMLDLEVWGCCDL